MTRYKLQHFVPKCHLRRFSCEDNPRSINIYNLERDKFFDSASLNNQCAKNFFYDTTGAIDAHFGKWESNYGHVSTKLIKTGVINSADLEFLREFALLQHLRTEETTKQQMLAFGEMREFVFHGDEEGKQKTSIDSKAIRAASLRHFLGISPYIGDLKDCIIENFTKIPFITSDNPGIILNRFHIQKQHHKHGGSGIINSGALLILPITPRYMFVSYDPGIYQAVLTGIGRGSIYRKNDVDSLNCLQLIRASENVYFHNSANSNYISNLSSRFRQRRRNSWYVLSYATEDKEQVYAGLARYSTVQTPSEFYGRNGLVRLRSISIDPGLWCSIFPFRRKPIYYDTHSAGGLVRSKALFDIRRMHRADSRPYIIPRDGASE